MPQLDINAFLTNFFWLLLIFFSLYIFIVKVVLPRILMIFVLRANTLIRLNGLALNYKTSADYCLFTSQGIDAFLSHVLVSFYASVFSGLLAWQSDYHYNYFVTGFYNYYISELGLNVQELDQTDFVNSYIMNNFDE